MLWAPAMALVSEASEEANLDQALAFAIAEPRLVGGHLLGGCAGAALAEATSDAGVPYALMAAACLLLGVTALVAEGAGARRRPFYREQAGHGLTGPRVVA